MYKSYGKFMHKSRTTKKKRDQGPKRFGQWSSRNAVNSPHPNTQANVPEEAKHPHPNEVRKRHPELQKSGNVLNGLEKQTRKQMKINRVHIVFGDPMIDE
jgi:hypothetical protein